MKKVKAIYLSQSYEPTNTPADAVCFTYDNNNGLLFHKNQNGGVLNVSSMDADVKQLVKDVKILKTDKKGGVVTDANGNTTISTISGNVTASGDVTIIQSPEFSAPVSKALSVSGKNVSIDGTVINSTTTTNASLNVNTKGYIDLANIQINGSFKTQTNQINSVECANFIMVDSVIPASGYNGVMIGQFTADINEPTVPSLVVFDNVDFTGNFDVATLNICATTDNATVLIRDCKFGKSEAPVRFRNATNAKGINVVIENCHFDESIFENENALILFEENGNVIGPDGKPDVIWNIVKKIASEAGVVLEKLPDGTMETGGSPTYVKRVFPYLLNYEDETNRFGTDKFTIVFKNCTYGPDNKKLTNTNKDLCQILRQSGRATFNAWNENWPTGKDFIVPQDDNEIGYFEYFEEIDWNNTLKNSQRYPKIIFE